MRTAVPWNSTGRLSVSAAGSAADLVAGRRPRAGGKVGLTMTTPSASDAVSSSAPLADREVTAETPVRVRFCPSPTGTPHVGLIRTALFNWAHARHTQGHVRVPHRGHGRGARLGGELPAAARGAEMAGHHLGRGRGSRRPARAVPPVAAPGPVQGRGGQADRRRLRLRVLLLAGGGRGPPPRRRPRPQARLRQLRPRLSEPSSSPRSRPRAASPCSACGCRTRTSRSPTWSAAKSPSRPAASRTTSLSAPTAPRCTPWSTRLTTP